jgi:hypothetical protein
MEFRAFASRWLSLCWGDPWRPPVRWKTRRLWSPRRPPIFRPHRSGPPRPKSRLRPRARLTSLRQPRPIHLQLRFLLSDPVALRRVGPRRAPVPRAGTPGRSESRPDRPIWPPVRRAEPLAPSPGALPTAAQKCPLRRPVAPGGGTRSVRPTWRRSGAGSPGSGQPSRSGRSAACSRRPARVGGFGVCSRPWRRISPTQSWRQAGKGEGAPLTLDVPRTPALHSPGPAPVSVAASSFSSSFCSSPAPSSPRSFSRSPGRRAIPHVGWVRLTVDFTARAVSALVLALSPACASAPPNVPNRMRGLPCIGRHPRHRKRGARPTGRSASTSC